MRWSFIVFLGLQSVEYFTLMLEIYLKYNEQYLKDVMNRYRNKLSMMHLQVRYEMIVTMSMLEDFWTPTKRRWSRNRDYHFPAVLILERLMISYTFNGNYTVHLTCRFQDLKIEQGFSLGQNN